MVEGSAAEAYCKSANINYVLSCKHSYIPSDALYICSGCGHIYAGTNAPTIESPVSGWSITLQDDICVNFKIDLAPTDTVQTIVNGEPVSCTLTDTGFSVDVAAAQMCDPIAISINGQPLQETYSVRSYANAILNGDYDAPTKELVKSMLLYGGAAQAFFGHSTDNLASEDISPLEAEPVGEIKTTVTGKLENLQFYGATLLHASKTAVRIYFTGSTEGLHFAANGQTVTALEKDGRYYVEIGGILPQELDKAVEVTVTDGTESMTVSYSPMDYILRMYRKTNSSEQIKSLVKALFGYYQAAKTYIS